MKEKPVIIWLGKRELLKTEKKCIENREQKEHLEPSHKDSEHLGPRKKIIFKLMYGSPCG